MAQQFKWQDAVIIFDNEDFQAGFARGRSFYFHSERPELKRPGASIEKASELIRIIAIPDGMGRFCADVDTDLDEQLEDLVGMLAGYLSGLSCPETREERRLWENG